MARSSLEPTWIGFDLNSTRVRAVTGPGRTTPRTLPLDGTAAELPLTISLEGRHPAVGRAGLALCRQAPHLVCHDFLAAVGQPRHWTAGRHRLDAERALALLCERLQTACAGARGLVLGLPAYLTVAQATTVSHVFTKARLPVAGSVAAPLAAVLAAHSRQPFSGLAVVVDADDHALSLSAVAVEDEQARPVADRVVPRLSLAAWKRALLDAVAERCVRQSRRDPRDSATADQLLYEQLDAVMETSAHGRPAAVAVQATQWFQNLHLQADEVVACCAKLLRATLDGISGLLAESTFQAPQALVLTEAASRLPGLTASLRDWFGEAPAEPAAPSTDDFGEALVATPSEAGVFLTVLSAEALATAAHGLADAFQRGLVPREHLAAAVPLGDAVGLGSGPPRLQFLDRDYPLLVLPFTLGRQPSCDLVFDSARYPTVSARHCEIVLERRGYLLRDRSRNGTFLNERPVAQQAFLEPGDWIRLGVDGPVLRFLGQAASGQKLGTTA
jgi:FHA domain